MVRLPGTAPMRLIDVSPLIPAQELADTLAEQFNHRKVRIEPSDHPPVGGKAVSRSSGWKDYPVSS